MIRLHPDPAVALCAYRVASESRPGEFHDVALMLGEGEPSDCPRGLHMTGRHEERLQGARVVCGLCRAVLRYWDCTCERATLAEKPCRHLPVAIEAYRAERAGRSP